MSRDKQIEEMVKDLCDGVCSLLECIPDKHCTSWRYAERAVDKGYRKASEVAREIIDILKSAGIDEWRYPVIAELKKKYTAEMKKIKIGEWVYGKFDIPHCSECGYEPTEISPFCPMCNANMESEDAE